MSYNGSGTFQINTSGQPVVAGTVISSTAFNALTADLATGLSTAITKDGQTATTVRIPFAAGISSTLVTDSSSVSTGSIITAGGVGVAKALFVGTTANIAGVLSTTSPNITTSITTPSTSFDLINATATTLNLGGAATAVNVGAATGTMTVANTTLAAKAITASTTLSVTGVTTVQAGTAALPAITTTGDTNTGIFFPAADTIAFTEGGVEAMRIDSSGNLLVGTTSVLTSGKFSLQADLSAVNAMTIRDSGTSYGVSSYYTLYQNSAGSTVGGIGHTAVTSLGINAITDLQFSTANTERMRIDSSGNVMIGTTSPILGGITGTNPQFTISGASNTNTNQTIANYFTGINGASLSLVKGRGTLASPTATSSADSLGDFNFSGYNTSNTIASSVRIQALQDGAGGATYVPGALTFLTATASAAATERVRIDTSGNLLVGESTATGNPLRGMQVLINSGQTSIVMGHVTGTTSGTQYLGFNFNGSVIGSITQSGTTAVLYNVTSDYRLKTVTSAVTGQGARIDALKPIDYQWKESNEQARGFLAHEFQEVYPSSVSGNKDAIDKDGKPAYQSMQASTSEVIADLVAEIQSLRKRLAALELA